MYHTRTLMQVFYGLCNLQNDVSAEILTEICQANDLMEQLATRTQLQHDIVIAWGFGELDEPDNVGMIELSHYLDFFQDIGTLRNRVESAELANSKTTAKGGG